MASQLHHISDSVPQRRRLHLKEITNEGASDTIGGLLRATRQKLGEDLKSAARVTKIRPEYLEALEEGKIDALPGRTYAVGFLKAYADFLGLDQGECVAKFKSEHTPPPPETEPALGIKEPEPEMRVPQGTLVIIGVVAILLIYAGVYLFRSANTYMDERAKQGATASAPVSGPVPSPAPPAPEATEATEGTGAGNVLPLPGTQDSAALNGVTAAPTGQDAAAAADPDAAATNDAINAPAYESSTATTPDEGMPAAAPEPEGVATSQDAPSATADPSYDRAIAQAPRSYGSAAGPSRLVLRATQNVFVRIVTSGPRQEVVHSGVLARGDVFYVPATANLVLVTRNGGALEVFLDRTYKGTLGPKGVALSNFALSPKSFER